MKDRIMKDRTSEVTIFCIFKKNKVSPRNKFSEQMKRNAVRKVEKRMNKDVKRIICGMHNVDTRILLNNEELLYI